MKLVPLEDRIVVRTAEAEETTVSGLVMLFSYHTSTSSVTVAGADSSTSGAPLAAPGAAGSVNSAGSTGSAGSAGSGSKTFRGDSVQTRWGPVQVAIEVAGGKITATCKGVFVAVKEGHPAFHRW